jgi:hypothetical protein
MSKTERTEIDPPAPDACAACPWRTANHRKPHAVGYYPVGGPARALAPTLVASATPPPTTQVSTVTSKISKADDAWKTQQATTKGNSPNKSGVPYAAYYAPYECNPWQYSSSNTVLDRYCWKGGPGGQYASDSMFAISWAQKHTKKSERDPVPFPSLGDGGGGKLAMLPHTVYVVYYTTAKKDFVGPVQADHIWKYGITSIPHWQDRANVGRGQCNKWEKAKGYRQECRMSYVSVNQATYGWDFGRFMEASLIKDYQRANGVCPPGQPSSCR